MNKPAIAFGLAGFAAAAAISTLAHPAGAPARQLHTEKVECSFGDHAGQAVQKTEYVKVNDARTHDGRAYLKRGDRVKTTDRGTGMVCLRAGNTTCQLDAGTRIRIRPSDKALARLNAGSITCKSQSGKRTPFAVETESLTIGLDALGPQKEVQRGLEGAAANAAEGSSGHLFSVAIRSGHTTVKVGRGVTLVARRTHIANAVVVGREKQVVALGAKDPNQPAPLKLSTKERRTFARLQQLLPPIRDKRPPGVTISKSPPNPASTRAARFGFSASEPNAVFTCSLDGGPFRVCGQSERFTGLAPGPHRLAVTAADLTGNIGPPEVFRWTIDSSQIVFTSERDGNREIYSMDPDGSRQQRLTNSAGGDTAPAWSPDAKQIAFGSERTGNSEVYVMNANGSDQRQLTRAGAFSGNPTWSPNGRQIAFESTRDGNSEIYVINTDGSGTRRLTNDPSIDFDPAWSPDGSRIAFASTRRQGNYDIYVMAADGSSPTILAPDPAIDFNPAWSPDSKKIAFHSDRDRESSQIYIVNADGTNVTRLTFTRATDYNPVWAPDGATLAFQSNLRGKDDIYIINADGGDLTQTTIDPAPDLVPDW